MGKQEVCWHEERETAALRKNDERRKDREERFIRHSSF
jgi:hypothetical protein